MIHYGGKCNKELVTEVPEKFSQSFELSSFIILSQNVLLKSPFFSGKKNNSNSNSNKKHSTFNFNSKFNRSIFACVNFW